MKILICGLPGAGKTTLGRELTKLLRGAILIDGDAVRELWNDKDFSAKGRMGQARRMSKLCDLIAQSGNTTVASFICPTHECRNAFGADFLIWIDRNGNKKYADTVAMWEDPDRWDLRVTSAHPPAYWADIAAKKIYDRIAGPNPWGRP